MFSMFSFQSGIAAVESRGVVGHWWGSLAPLPGFAGRGWVRGFSSGLAHQPSLNSDQKFSDSNGSEFVITTNLKKSPHPNPLPAKPERGNFQDHRLTTATLPSG